MSQPVGLPTPAYTNLPACLPATYKILTHLTYPHLQRWRPGIIKYCRPALPCTVLPVHVPTCLPTPAYTSLPAYTSPAAPVLATKLPTAYTFHFTELRHGVLRECTANTPATHHQMSRSPASLLPSLSL